MLSCLRRWFKRPKGRIIFLILEETDTYGAVKATPHHKRWPLLGETTLGIKIKSGKQRLLKINPVDKHQNPAPVDGKPEWFVDNPNLLALQVSDDGMACLVSTVGPIGTAKVSVKCDANLDPNAVTPLFGQADFDVGAGDAVALGIEVGDEVDEPAPEPTPPAPTPPEPTPPAPTPTPPPAQ